MPKLSYEKLRYVEQNYGVIRSIYNAAYESTFITAVGSNSARSGVRAAAAVMAASAAVAAPRNALLPPTLPSTPLPPMLVVVVMGVTYAEGIKGCSELESLASLTTTIITTTFTY